MNAQHTRRSFLQKSTVLAASAVAGGGTLHAQEKGKPVFTWNL